MHEQESPTLPVEDILVNVAESVVEAQQALDTASLASEVRIREQELDKLGLKSHWYTIPELDFDLRLAFEIGDRGELETEMVDADYQSRYGFNLKASSLLQTRIVATPPGEVAGLSLLDERFVLERAGQIKKIVEAYDRADTPHFAVRYRPFSRTGYDGGLWYALLLDTLATGETRLRALVAVDDASREVVRLWTDEPITAKGVTFTAEEATRTVLLANTIGEEVLRDVLDLPTRTVANLLEARPFDRLLDLAEVDQVGRTTLEKLRALANAPPSEPSEPEGGEAS